jgi:hypothetical protein
MAGLVRLEGFLLEAGTPLFKGDNAKYFDQYKTEGTVSYDDGRPAYFAFEKEVSALYGIIFEFTVEEPIFIVDLGDDDVVSNLYQHAPRKIQKIITEHYGFDPKSGTIKKRDSVHKQDNILSKYLCSIGAKGYVLDKQLETELGGKFHREVMLCDPSTLQFSKLVGFSKDKQTIEKRKPTMMDEEQIQNKMKEKKMKEELIESRKNRRLSMRPPRSSASMGRFSQNLEYEEEDEDDEEDDEEAEEEENDNQILPLNQNLFGTSLLNSTMYDSPKKTPSPRKKTKTENMDSYKTP